MCICVFTNTKKQIFEKSCTLNATFFSFIASNVENEAK
jgi:hypothetical protein